MNIIRKCSIYSIFASTLVSFSAFAVQPFEVTCGDGATISITDSEYSPSTAAMACLTSGHQAPKQQRRSASHALSKTPLTKIVTLKNHRGDANIPSSVDHSDFILLAQGCECISPNCVAYSCPVDAEVP